MKEEAAFALPPAVSPSSFRYTADFDCIELKDDDFAPDGYPGKLTAVLPVSPALPTLTRMFSHQNSWSQYQPHPTDTYGQQQWSQAPPPPMPPPGGPKRRAFICGINYIGTSARLNGCINDANCVEYLLKSKFGFTQDQILKMTDDHPDPMRRPTKANMYLGFQWLMTGLQPGDSLFFHYSGHGSQERDRTGEEADGMNETLCPMDFQSAGQIIDDDLNRMLINPLPQGVKLHCLTDSCHSGSTLDLPFQAHVQNGVATWRSGYSGQTRTWKGTAGGFAVHFSAASDNQTAADTSQLSGTGVATGAASFCFIKAIEERGTQNVTYGDLLLSMHRTLHQAGLGGNSGGGGGQGGYDGRASGGGFMPLVGMLGGALLGGGGGGGGGIDSMLASMLAGAGGGAGFRGQEPVMSANYAFDMSYKFSL